MATLEVEILTVSSKMLPQTFQKMKAGTEEGHSQGEESYFHVNEPLGFHFQ